MLKVGTFLQNRYEIVGHIGTGGMADVYKAKDHKLNRNVAVKILKEEYRQNKEFLSKFRVEAQAAAGLSHVNIVNVYDVGVENGINFIVMELVDGITLKNYIAKKGKLSVKEATSIAIQVCDGLEAAHNNGIIHRDVKPQNILISTSGKAKIADFGIAMAVSSNTYNSTAVGSVHYSSPEQSRGGYSDVKSDIYSLGITMYEMITGRLPFDGDNTVQVALAHLNDEIPSPRKYAPDIPFSTEQIILKCTQKSPNKRYASAADLGRDLRESLVNPNGNFVVIPILEHNGRTVEITDEELKQIKKGLSPSYDPDINTGVAGRVRLAGNVTGDQRSYSSGGSYFQNSGYQNAGRGTSDGAYQDSQADTLSDPSYGNDDAEQGNYDEPAAGPERPGRRRGSSGADDMGTRVERIVTIVSIVAAVAAGIVILALIGRAVGLFPSSGSGKNRNNSQTQQETPGSETRAMPGSDRQEGQTEAAPATVAVPNLIGRTEDEARTALRDLGLGAQFIGEVSSSEYAKGLVVRQTVPADTGVEAATTIGYELSSGSDETMTVPDLEGTPRDDALRALQSMGVDAAVEMLTSSTVEEGKVITTNPGVGSTIKPGSKVILYVSQGENTAMVEVPKVTGHYVDDAQTVLTNLGLYCFVTETPDRTADRGIVLSQDVEPGTSVQSGSAVTLIVSSGPEGQQDEQVLNQEDRWMCNVWLQEPSGYNGEPVRIVLVQGDESTVLFEGVTDFPYFVSAEGQPGAATGTIYIYSLDINTWDVIQTTMYEGIEFDRL